MGIGHGEGGAGNREANAWEAGLEGRTRTGHRGRQRDKLGGLTGILGSPGELPGFGPGDPGEMGVSARTRTRTGRLGQRTGHDG